MLALFPTSSPRNISRRADSLNSTTVAAKPDSGSPQHPIFAAIDDDLRDVRRVSTHGQEEDLRTALGRVIGRVEELSTLLRTAYRTTADLEASLSVAKSNLALIQSNNDMLEEALKRGDSSGSGQLSKDVGWRRWSTKEVQQREQKIEEERPKSMDSGPWLSKSTTSLPSSPNLNATTLSPNLPLHPPQSTLSPFSPPSMPPTTTPIAMIASTTPAIQESRFFRGFRFTGGSTTNGTSTPIGWKSNSPANAQGSANNTGDGSGVASPANLSSPSLPSLVSRDSEAGNEKEKQRERDREKERERLEELCKELEKEKEARKKADSERLALETEIESLSQALFEEANKMVAHERIKRAETEEELREAKTEKEALKSALKVVECENGRLRKGSLIYPIVESEKKRIVYGDDDDEGVEAEGGERRRATEMEDVVEGMNAKEEASSAIDGMKDGVDTETDPSISRSSSRMGIKSPVRSRQSSESRSVDLPIPVPAPVPVPAPTPTYASSIPFKSSPMRTQSPRLSLPQDPSTFNSSLMEENPTHITLSQCDIHTHHTQLETDHAADSIAATS